MTAFTTAAWAAAVILGMAVITILLAGMTFLAAAGLIACLAGLAAGLWRQRGFRRASRDIDQAIANVSGAGLPGPGQPQASGAGTDGDTHVKGWSADEIAYLRGELKELPK